MHAPIARTVETVFTENHQFPWAITLQDRDGNSIALSLNDSSWSSSGRGGPMYDVHLGLDQGGYQTFLPIHLDSRGLVNARETLSGFELKPGRDALNPWIVPLVTDWVRTLDGRALDEGVLTRIEAGERVADSCWPIYRPGTYENDDGIRSFQSPVVFLDEPSWGSLPAETKRIVFYGGLGAVVPRFYQAYIDRYKGDANIELIAVDLLPEDLAWKRIREQGLPYVKYFHASDFRMTEDSKPDGMVILTRPDSHYRLVMLATDLGVPAYVEKPIFHPNDLPSAAVSYNARRESIFAVDFFFDNPSVQEAVKIIDQGFLGKIQSIEGEMLESVPIEKGREWLCDSNISGGGMGMDMMVHLTAATELFLERWGHSLSEFRIDPHKLLFARYEGAPPGSETYARISGSISGVIPMTLSAGKGLSRSSYFIRIKGSKGELEVNLGTEEEPGFMKFTPLDGQPIKLENQSEDIGYRGTVLKILQGTVAPKDISLTERDFRFRAATLSVRILADAQTLNRGNYRSIPFGIAPEGI